MSGLINQLKKAAASGAASNAYNSQRNSGVPEFSPEMRFSLQPLPGDSGFSQWHSAMKMVSQLPEGIPAEFRRQLWLSLADKHLHAKGVDWPAAERDCFSEWSHPADAELGVQIVKDLHRTGCSLFCGKDGKENQALLKRVLLAYARWNKNVGYCQGFNMLAALILQVTEKSEVEALKLMIYLIEGVLPDSYFADSLRGLSVDMAVFRELLRTKLPKLSKHLDTLQVASKEGTTSYEPPLTNVFTMQWFLTLFCNCLPQPTVLRVWDLILLEGNEILLRTSLAIWQVLADRIMTAKTADEFYCVMGMLMREILEFDLIDANTLVKGIVSIGPLTELSVLREHYLYNINPWGATPISRSEAPSDGSRRNKVYHKDKLVLDIGVLKKQYTKLKQRQRQAHVIFNTAVARQTARPAPVAMNHLLLGKSALVPAKKGMRPGPPKGSVPPPRHAHNKQTNKAHPPQQIKPVKIAAIAPPKTLHWKDEGARKRSPSSSSSSSDTELCDEPEEFNSDEEKGEDNKKSQLPELPDDNLTTLAMPTAVLTPLSKTTSLIEGLDHAQPDLTSDNSDKQRSDIDVALSSETIDNYDPVLSETSASALPVNVIPDLLDFVEPPIDTSIAAPLSFNIDEFLSENTENDNSIIETYDKFDVLETSSDIYPTTDVATDDYFMTLNASLQRSDSLPSEDGFDFEKFLEERVKCLKDTKDKLYSSEESLDDTSETERIKYARKNSVRALEIIQENSLILHRILQCQSRLTPTPPPYEDLDSNKLENDLQDGGEKLTPTTPTPTNENQGTLLLTDFTSKNNDDVENEQEIIEIDVKTPEKLNVFRPYGDFTEFLLKYQSKTPDAIDVVDIENKFSDFEVKKSESNELTDLPSNLVDEDDTPKNHTENDSPEKFLFEFEDKLPITQDLQLEYAPVDDLTSFFNNSNYDSETQDKAEDNIDMFASENLIENLTNVDIETDKIEVRENIDVEDDDATYLNRLISKYNFISKQHEHEDPLNIQSEEKNEKDERDKLNRANEIDETDESTHVSRDDSTLEFSIADIEIPAVSAIYRPMAATNIVEVDYNLEKYRHKLGSPLADTENKSEPTTETTQAILTTTDLDEDEDLIEIGKNSKYNSILEYSRNLDEKFNNLILKSPKLSKLQKSERLNLKGNYSLDLPLENVDIDGGRHFEDASDLTPKASHSFQDFTALTKSDIDLSPKMASSSSKSYIMTTEVDQQEDVATSYASTRNTMDVDVLIESPSLKSPNRIYNPFPVSISSRQSKEVPFRLGLYKK
ncbi:uncharacterized protein [Atheta coriaria]|uniref:uncharacterized protein isoform X2 n=1 Tax=Dalotia coriaria TaxID=877792 RepID=UPI0031F3F495